MKLTHTTYNVLTGETTVRDYTTEEVAEYQAERALNAQILLEQTTQAEAKATARQVILDRLGLTAEEAALLLG